MSSSFRAARTLCPTSCTTTSKLWNKALKLDSNQQPVGRVPATRDAIKQKSLLSSPWRVLSNLSSVSKEHPRIQFAATLDAQPQQSILKLVTTTQRVCLYACMPCVRAAAAPHFGQQPHAGISLYIEPHDRIVQHKHMHCLTIKSAEGHCSEESNT